VTTPRFTILAAQVNPAQIHTARAEDRDYLVLPVVALVGDSVVRPLNSDGPEFVPLRELAVAPGQWAGRPIVADHPAGGTGSANDPKVLEAQRYGWVYCSDIQNGKLCAEGWLDPERAEKIGGDAVRVVDVARRAMAGEEVDPVEVSVGCWVTLIREDGVSPSGVPYEYRWTGVASDHLAVGLNGATGACSVDSGCGAPRAAQALEAAALSGENATSPQPPIQINEPKAVLRAAEQEKNTMKLPKRILDALAATLGFRASAEDEGPSDVDLRDALYAALRAIEAGFDWIAEVYPDSSTVIYTTFPEDAMLWWRRSYAVAEDGTVTLADDREQVEPVTRYEPLAAKTDGDPEPEQKPTNHPATAKAACGCPTKGEGLAAPAPKQSEGVTMEKVKELVGRLIANEASPFTDEDQAGLEALSEAKLEALDAALQPGESAPEPEPAPAPTPVAEEPADDDDTVKLSREEYDDIKASAAAYKAQQAAMKAKLVAQLKGAQDAYSEAELAAMPIFALEKVAKLAKVEPAPQPSYAGRGLASDETDNRVPPPPDFGEAVRALRSVA
jgi:hypothetical protein